MFAQRRYRFGYAWFSIQEDGTVLVGANEDFYRETGLIVYCDLPLEHDRVVKAQACARMISAHGQKPWKFLSPLTGTVLKVNEKMLVQPYLAQKDPYGEAWLFVMVPSRFEEEIKKSSAGNRYAEPLAEEASM